MKNPKYWIEKNCQQCQKKFWSLISRNGRFCSNKCSVVFTSNDESRMKKIRQTKLKRYGSETYVNPQKAKQTCFQKYGVDNASKSSAIIEKIKQSNLEKYGVEWSWQNSEVKEKIKNTNIIKYGVENPSQSDEIKQKKERTFLEKYGVNNPFQSSKVKEYVKLSYKEKYGREYPSQIKEIRKKILKSLLANNYQLLLTTPKMLNDIEILFSQDEYKGTNVRYKYKVKCRKCGNIFEDHFDGNGHPRCLICYPNIAGFSFAEKEIVEYIHSILLTDVPVIERDRSLLKNREIDIYLPSKKIAIEYNGLFWHSELNGKDSSYHLNKLNKCKEKGVKLITIFEDEWNNYKNDIKSKLSELLSSTLPTIETKPPFYFLDNNQQCTILNVDRRWDDESPYLKLGFVLEEVIGPSYWYFKPGYAIKYHKSEFSESNLKNKLFVFNSKLSEWENMQLNGYDRIWDCGTLKLSRKLDNNVHI